MRRRDSIEFLWDELKPFLPKSYTEEESIKILSILKQAKAMHKEEVTSFTADWSIQYKYENGKNINQFYNETFGGNNEH